MRSRGNEGTNMTFSEALDKLNLGYRITHTTLGSLSHILSPKDSVFVKVKPQQDDTPCYQKLTVLNMNEFYVHTIGDTDSYLTNNLSKFKKSVGWQIDYI